MVVLKVERGCALIGGYKVERSLIYLMLKKKEMIEIDKSLFSRSFLNWYSGIGKCIDKKLDVSVDNVELLLAFDGVEIDREYPVEPVFESDDVEVFYKVFLDNKIREKKAERIAYLSSKYKESGNSYYLKEIGELTGDVDVGGMDVVPIGNYVEGQREFVDGMLKGQRPKGLWLYDDWGYGSSQFVKLGGLLGVIAPDNYVVIGARPSVGKTAFGLALLNALGKNGYKGLFISLETTVEKLIHRMALAKSGISGDMFNKNKMTAVMAADYYKALEQVKKSGHQVVSNPVGTWLDLKNLIVRNRKKFDFVIIDYLGLIGSFDGRDTTTDRNAVITKISRDIKVLATSLEIPIIVLSQLNRASVEGKVDGRYVEPQLHQLRDSGSIEQDANQVIFLWRDNRLSKDEREIQESVGIFKTRVKIEKNRDGKTGIVDMEFNANLMRWKEL